MYIIQMADFHIGSAEKTNPSEERLLIQSINFIKDKIPIGETVLLCLCGDMIDSKGLKNEDKEIVEQRYLEAEKLIETSKEHLEDAYKVVIKCCPGNHDITHENEFYHFVKTVDTSSTPSLSGLKSCYKYKIENENSYCVFVNSCGENQYEYGSIEDYEKLEHLLESLPSESSKILVLHHTIISMDEDDKSSIRNAAKLIELVNRYNITAILHGHTHGREILRIGNNQCKVVGTGALFSRANTNINSQFNIIQYKNGWVMDILNCRYNMDEREEPWIAHNVVELENENYFKGRNFEEVYKNLESKLSVRTPLYNVTIQISNDFNTFSDNLNKYLEDEKLVLGDRSYTYFQLAEMWEREKVPEELYFNHGSCFAVDGKTGIDFVQEQLQRKPTSNRIILSTYSMKDVVKTLDDSDYLPSLDSIQFGMEGQDELLVHMYLRALETSRFLKINICEIDYILKKLQERSMNFKKVKIIISAFRAQKRERFNCFLKAGIDMLSQSKLDSKVNHKKIGDLCKLLQEKRDARETITQTDGIEIIFNSMKSSNDEEEEGALFLYSDEIINLFEKVLKVYKELDAIHRNRSIRSEEERNCEEKIDKLLETIIRKLEKFEKEKKEREKFYDLKRACDLSRRF